ncbi:DUF2182 domain-containing protein, partial [Phytoactinopolyspora endophytica]|uniref:copper chaperone n=1 Tax=Phytoactinopolyspora endophytica TaxID=1642495 RepID=UPI00197C1E4D
MTARRSVVIEPALTRDRATALLSVVVIAALAWVYLARTGDAPMGTAGGATDLVLLFAMWAAMMTAMMAPSAAPLVLMFATINRRQREARQPYVATSVLLLGYIAVWTGFAALASGMQWTLHEFGALSSWMDGVAPIAGGTVLIVAGVFQ